MKSRILWFVAVVMIAAVTAFAQDADEDLVGAIVRAQSETAAPATLPEIEDSAHPSVDALLARMIGPERDYSAAGLRRYGRWRARLAAEIDRQRMPRDLLALAFVESLYKPKAASKSDAGGFWQILPATARLHDLRRDAFVDERYDPDRATAFACGYLRALYEQFGNWPLALAAYNLGRGDLSRLIESGAPADFFALRDKGLLRAETADYVPRILAARRILADPKAYGFEPVVFDEAETVGLVVRPLTDLRLLETLAGVSGGTISEHNPGLRTDYAPPDPGGYSIVVPAARAEALDAINLKERAVSPWNDLRGLRRVEVKIKGSRTLYSIGRDYDTSLSSLRRWNGLALEQTVSKGDKVVVYVRDDFVVPEQDR